MSSIELYDLPGCAYCAKVKRKLEDLGLEYETHEVPASHDDRDQVEAISGQTAVPVIVDPAHGIEGMAESDDIVDYLEETYGTGGGPDEAMA